MPISWNEIDAFLEKIPYACPVKKFLGLECAFCGMTHSWIALLRGEWALAFQYNPLGPLLFLLFCIFLLLVATKRLPQLSAEVRRKIALYSLVGLFLFSLARNIARNIT